MRILLGHKRKEQLLNDLCVKLGFCLSSEAHERVMTNTPQELASFVDAIFKEEGLDPEIANKRLKRLVRDMILKANETA
jgi:hypothetical protein